MLCPQCNAPMTIIREWGRRMIYIYVCSHCAYKVFSSQDLAKGEYYACNQN